MPLWIFLSLLLPLFLACPPHFRPDPDSVGGFISGYCALVPTVVYFPVDAGNGRFYFAQPTALPEPTSSYLPTPEYWTALSSVTTMASPCVTTENSCSCCPSPAEFNYNNNNNNEAEEYWPEVLQLLSADLDDTATATATATAATLTDPPGKNSRRELEHRFRRIYSTLLQKINEAATSAGLAAVKAIPWGRVRVHGWPQSVLFYSRKCWNAEDAAQLEASLPRIRFEILDRTQKAIPEETGREIYAALRRLHERHFASYRLEWRQNLKRLLPSLHLISPFPKQWRGADMFQLQKLIAILESNDIPGAGHVIQEATVVSGEDRSSSLNGSSNLNDSTSLIDNIESSNLIDLDEANIDVDVDLALDLTDANDENNANNANDANDNDTPDVNTRRTQLSKQFLQKLQRTTTTEKFTAFEWRRFDVIGWPKDVMFLSPWCWREHDISILEAAIDEIHVSLRATPKSIPPAQVRQKLAARLQEVVRETLGAANIPWFRDIKAIMPELQLTTFRSREWTDDDVASIERLIDTLASLPTKDSPLRYCSPINQMRRDLYAKLAAICKANLKRDSDDIPWARVRVHNWPQSVLFFAARHWSKANMKLIEASLSSIVFEPLSEAEVQENRSLKTRRQLFEKLTRISNAQFGPAGHIQWQEFKYEFPNLHLSTVNYDKWNAQDCRLIEQIIDYYDTVADSSATAQGSSAAAAVEDELDESPQLPKKPRLAIIR